MVRRIDKIVNEQINNLIESKRNMLREYKNPNDRDTVKVCTDQLENLYNSIIERGNSRHDYAIERLSKIIRELRKIERYFS